MFGSTLNSIVSCERVYTVHCASNDQDATRTGASPLKSLARWAGAITTNAFAAISSVQGSDVF